MHNFPQASYNLFHRSPTAFLLDRKRQIHTRPHSSYTLVPLPARHTEAISFVSSITHLFHVTKIKADENSGVRWINIEDIEKNVTEKWVMENVYAKLVNKLKEERYK